MLCSFPGRHVEPLSQPKLDRNSQNSLDEVAQTDGPPDLPSDDPLQSDHRRDHAREEDGDRKRQRPVERRPPLCDLARLLERLELGRVERRRDDGVERQGLDSFNDLSQGREGGGVGDSDDVGLLDLREGEVGDSGEGGECFEQGLEVVFRGRIGQAVDLDRRDRASARREDKGVEANVAYLLDNLLVGPALIGRVQHDGALGEEGDLDADDTGESGEGRLDGGDASAARPVPNEPRKEE